MSPAAKLSNLVIASLVCGVQSGTRDCQFEMPKNTRKRTSKGPETAEEEPSNVVCVCTVCAEHIKEATDACDGQDALFCEGVCQRWFHRRYVGMSREQFQPLTEASEPFLCPVCVSQQQQKAILELQGNVQALTAEILELKAAVAALQRTSQPAGGGQANVKSSGGIGKLPWNVVAGGKKRDKGKGRASNSAYVPKGKSTGTPIPQATEATESHKPPLVKVSGAREIWGTRNNTTTTAVAYALKSLAKIPSDSLTIKRKYKTAKGNSKQVVRWWFVVRGEEQLLEKLQTDWSSVSTQTTWKLEPVLEFQKEDSPMISAPPSPSTSAPPLPPQASTNESQPEFSVSFAGTEQPAATFPPPPASPPPLVSTQLQAIDMQQSAPSTSPSTPTSGDNHFLSVVLEDHPQTP